MKTKLDATQLRRLEAFGYNPETNSIEGVLSLLPRAIRIDGKDSDNPEGILDLTIDSCNEGGLTWIVYYRGHMLESDSFVEEELIDALYKLAIIVVAKNYIMVA